MGKKTAYNIEIIRQDAESRGYQLLSKKFKLAKDKLLFECDKGHTFESVYHNFKKGHGCPVCSRNKKLNYANVKSYIESFNYVLVSDSYKNARTKLELICPLGHQYQASFECFRRGQRCSTCNGGVRYNIEKVRQMFINAGLIPLFTEYRNQSQQLEYLCKKHKEIVQYKTLSAFYRSKGCRLCGIEKSAQAQIGELNHGWKGGITPIILFLRGSLKKWKYDSLKEYGFKCVISNTNNRDLEVHHLFKGYSEILSETLEKLDLDLRGNIQHYSKAELEEIESLFVELNYKYGLGLPLKRNIHDEFHIKYGFGKNTYEQFKEFALNTYNIDLDNIINKKYEFYVETA